LFSISVKYLAYRVLIAFNGEQLWRSLEIVSLSDHPQLYVCTSNKAAKDARKKGHWSNV